MAPNYYRIYDVNQISRLVTDGMPEFHEPPAGPFYHYPSGDLTPYGYESLLVLKSPGPSWRNQRPRAPTGAAQAAQRALPRMHLPKPLSNPPFPEPLNNLTPNLLPLDRLHCNRTW